MARPQGMEFGVGPAHRIVTGAICIAVGLLFLLLGTAGIVHVLDRWPKPAVGPGVVAALFVLGGLLVSVSGLFAVIKRHEARIILAEDAVHVGPYYTAIPYRDITGVSRGTDGEVMLKRVGRFLGYNLPPFFASEAEVARFIDELTHRIAGPANTRPAS